MAWIESRYRVEGGKKTKEKIYFVYDRRNGGKISRPAGPVYGTAVDIKRQLEDEAKRIANGLPLPPEDITIAGAKEEYRCNMLKIAKRGDGSERTWPDYERRLNRFIAFIKSDQRLVRSVTHDEIMDFRDSLEGGHNSSGMLAFLRVVSAFLSLGSGTFFRDWTIELNSAGLSYGLENVINGDSRGAFYMDFLYASDNDYSILKSSPIPIVAYPTDKLKFTFEYLARPSIQAHWARFGFKIIATGGSNTLYYTNNPLFNTSISSPWVTTDTLNEIYADKYGEFVKLEFPMKAVEDATHIEIRFYLQANNRYDYSSIGSLPSLLSYGTKRTVGRTIDTEDHISYYTYIDTNEPDDSPNLVVAGDGAWKLEKTIRFDNDASILNSILIDNVKIEYLPSGEEPDEEDVFTYVNSAAIKTNFEETVLHGDVADENNARNIYKNYLRLSDGTPTASWARDGFSESKALIQILLEDYLAQFTESNYRIQAPIFYDFDLTFLVTLEDQFDGGRQYVLASLEEDVKQDTANVEMIEIKEGISLSNFDSAFSTAFGTQYD